MNLPIEVSGMEPSSEEKMGVEGVSKDLQSNFYVVTCCYPMVHTESIKKCIVHTN